MVGLPAVGRGPTSMQTLAPKVLLCWLLYVLLLSLYHALTFYQYNPVYMYMIFYTRLAHEQSLRSGRAATGTAWRRSPRRSSGEIELPCSSGAAPTPAACYRRCRRPVAPLVGNGRPAAGRASPGPSWSCRPPCSPRTSTRSLRKTRCTRSVKRSMMPASCASARSYLLRITCSTSS